METLQRKPSRRMAEPQQDDTQPSHCSDVLANASGSCFHLGVDRFNWEKGSRKLLGKEQEMYKDGLCSRRPGKGAPVLMEKELEVWEPINQISKSVRDCFDLMNYFFCADPSQQPCLLPEACTLGVWMTFRHEGLTFNLNI